MRNRQISAVDIASNRAGLPHSFLNGRATDEVARIVPTLFSICRSAQAAAASGALDAATGVTAANGNLQQRCGSVRQEAVVEMLTRLLIDWPRVMQAEPDAAAVARVRRSREDEILDTCRDVACTSVFGVDCEQWLNAMSLDGLPRWLARGETMPARLLARLQTESPDLGCSVVPSMPDATLDALNGAILPRLAEDASLALRPDWLGTPTETGSIARVGTHRWSRRSSSRTATARPRATSPAWSNWRCSSPAMVMRSDCRQPPGSTRSGSGSGSASPRRRADCCCTSRASTMDA